MRGIIRSKNIRLVFVILVIIATFAIFGWYLASHPTVIDVLLHLSPWIIVLLTIAYLLTIVANALILHFSLSYVKRSTPLLDNVFLTGYSSIVNFFGPLQSGPGFRAIYLKKKYGVEIRRFIVATLIFYFFFGTINLAVMIISAFLQFPEWRSIIIVSVLSGLVALVPLIILLRRTKRGNNFFRNIRFSDRSFWLIGVGALLLTLSTAFAFGIEIYHVASGISLWQVVVYTAVANLSLFVSLTPGAIGFREAFLVFSEHLHNLSTDVIAAASVIDRAFYIVFLLLLFIVLLAINSTRHIDIFNQKFKSGGAT